MIEPPKTTCKRLFKWPKILNTSASCSSVFLVPMVKSSPQRTNRDKVAVKVVAVKVVVVVVKMETVVATNKVVEAKIPIKFATLAVVITVVIRAKVKVI